MNNVFIIPTGHEGPGNPALARAAVCDMETLLSLIPPGRFAEELKGLYPGGVCYIRGVRERIGDNEATWGAMTPGDLILDYRERAIFSAAFLAAKKNDSVLALKLWPGDGPFGLLCFTDKPRVGEVPILSQMLRYLDGEHKVLVKLGADKVGNILADYGSLETFVNLCLRYDFPFSFRHS